MSNPAMQDVRTIVAATDLSPASNLAVEQAALLAKQFGAKLRLLHVFNDGFWSNIKAIYAAEHWVDTAPALVARNHLLQQVEEIAKRHAIEVCGATRTGRAASEIVIFGREQGAHLLVVGEHGEDWLGDQVIGGTALKVLKRADFPVMLVRRPVSATFSKILVATDFSDNANRAAQCSLRWFPHAYQQFVHAYFVAFEGRMRLAGASDKDIERYRDQEMARAERNIQAQINALEAESAVDKLLIRGAPAPVIIEQAARLEADLVVIGKHGGTVLDELLLGSVTLNVLYHADCNVLLVP